MKEVWKDIPGFEGLYKISSYGKVKTEAKTSWMERNKCYRTFKSKSLSPTLTNRGYFMIWLKNKSGNREPIGVHVLVAMAFLNHVPSGHKIVVDHIDENKQNNHVSNLQLITHRENVIKSINYKKSWPQI